MTESATPISRTPLFIAQHSERYARQDLVRRYQDLTGANLIVMIDQIFPDNMTFLEELLHPLDSSKPLHLMLASPGGDGETAIRIARSLQARCTDLTILLPDMAKSAATILCLGADKIVFGPGGDLGPVDPQMRYPNGTLASAKELVEAVDEAEKRITANPETYPLFANLLAEVTMIMVEQARYALARSGALVKESLSAATGRTAEDVEALAEALQQPLIEEPTSHSAVIGVEAAKSFGLPAEAADPDSDEWAFIWSLWTRYFNLGAFPVGPVAIYEGDRASQIIRP
ncbi:SDH family Clp fold serine proteinase [Mumia sp. DW29H23]|uniref:SDH family Clp fold serine proteinase n=1 Tax=Mumia sp. DW29H23 TaxID=3421241 RepID=UPI003D6871E4